MLQKNAFGQKNFFWPKAFFWSIMKMAIRKFFITCPRVCQIQDLCRKKYKKGIFSDVQWWKQISTHFSDSTHQECMIFARIGHGPCYYHWNEIFAGVGCLSRRKASTRHRVKNSRGKNWMLCKGPQAFCWCILCFCNSNGSFRILKKAGKIFWYKIISVISQND